MSDRAHYVMCAHQTMTDAQCMHKPEALQHRATFIACTAGSYKRDHGLAVEQIR
jgi:hypothetical protein